MSMTHEYVVFDEAKIEKILKLRWSSFDKKFSWSEWENSKEMLVEFGLGESDVERVGEILAKKTVRQTILLSDTPFLFFHVMLNDVTEGKHQLWDDGAGLSEESGFEYAEKIVACACLAFVQGRISFEMMTAVCDLHYLYCDPAQYLPAETADRWNQCRITPMLSQLPGLFPDSDGSGLGALQTGLFFDFISQAWDGKWRLYSKDQKPGDRRTIRSVVPAGRLYRIAKSSIGSLKKPCIYLYYCC